MSGEEGSRQRPQGTSGLGLSTEPLYGWSGVSRTAEDVGDGSVRWEMDKATQLVWRVGTDGAGGGREDVPGQVRWALALTAILLLPPKVKA